MIRQIERNKTVCDIVVLTWNKLELTKKFITSYLKHTLLSTRVIFVDNNSTDGTKEYLRSLTDTDHCQFHVIYNSKNEGFVTGVNQGLNIVSAPYIGIVNNDVIFTDGWLNEIIALFQKRPEIGLLNPNSNTLAAKVPAGTSLDNFAKNLKKNKKGCFVEMPFCVGFCMVIKNETFKKADKLSNEFYPMFFEDTDYSLKVRIIL